MRQEIQNVDKSQPYPLVILALHFSNYLLNKEGQKRVLLKLSTYLNVQIPQHWRRKVRDLQQISHFNSRVQIHS